MAGRGEGGLSVLWSTSLLLVVKLHLVSAEFCQSERASWQCACGCCEDYDYCCVSCASYWYAWLLLTLFFLVCICACLGCGSYGYRRYRQPLGMSSYIVGQTPRSTYAPPSEADKLNQRRPSSYQPYTTVTPATGHHDYQYPTTDTGYHGNQSEMPPPYNPSQPPPPYSAH
ncbi:hypothetical protein GBAR_LOCUS4644 [Geodia barretti]|uniref:Vesicular, overexpressed in cancer, prosurvival protein 1 n=1 Tax=Geodia barretti TaxID=519541 RepID=A0AA35R7P4_GEOBA|nr:hypothetical protein GBAR_LOCUS4644 [Geodia barretti]